MHGIYLVRRGRKYHTDQSHRILLTHYFFTLRRGGILILGSHKRSRKPIDVHSDIRLAVS